MGSWSPSPISQNTARALLSMREEYFRNRRSTSRSRSRSRSPSNKTAVNSAPKKKTEKKKKQSRKRRVTPVRSNVRDYLNRTILNK